MIPINLKIKPIAKYIAPIQIPWGMRFQHFCHQRQLVADPQQRGRGPHRGAWGFSSYRNGLFQITRLICLVEIKAAPNPDSCALFTFPPYVFEKNFQRFQVEMMNSWIKACSLLVNLEQRLEKGPSEEIGVKIPPFVVLSARLREQNRHLDAEKILW